MIAGESEVADQVYLAAHFAMVRIEFGNSDLELVQPAELHIRHCLLPKRRLADQDDEGAR